jgi:hypothetical protein
MRKPSTVPACCGDRDVVALDELTGVEKARLDLVVAVAAKEDERSQRAA